MKPIYLDYNATTPIDPEVAETMRPFLYDHFGNPSSSHWYGAQARQAVEAARRQVAALLGCNTDEIIFTSGGSESNNHAIKGAALAGRASGNHIITSAVEHPAVAEVCNHLERQGFRVTRLPVDEHGLIDPVAVAQAITPQTILITIMHANNEVGTIQPIFEIAAVARKHGIPLHCDAAQSLGKMPVRVDELGVDLLSIAGHKLYAPKGVGALYIRRGVRLEKLIHGADHEQNMRAGTENVMLVAGLGKACEIAGRDIDLNMRRMRTMRDRLHQGLQRELEGIRLNGHPDKRLPNTLSIGFAGIEADTLLSEVREVAASPGAACHSEAVELSPVLTAMGVPPEYAIGTVRFSTGRSTSEQEIDRAVNIIATAVKRLQPAVAGAPAVPAAETEIKLTRFTHGLGCACKLRPQALEEVLAQLPVPDDVNVLVGAGTSDDAAVYRLPDGSAIVQTLDFFTPIVDDPADFGAIAAANAFSDIYAMGGTPLFALNIVGFPSNRLPLQVLHRILQGAVETAAEAGVSIIGGHSIDDTEPKYGLAVSGLIDPDRIITNSGARPGDTLILTKPLGLGIMTTAMKRGLADQAAAARVVAIMRTLNRNAAETMVQFNVHACTDITGFGLLGHLKEMTCAAGVEAEIWLDRLPTIPEAWEMAAANVVPGGSLDNMEYVADTVEWAEDIPRVAQIILCDAQTSGGLLISVPPDDAERLLAALHERGVEHAVAIGRITGQGSGRIAVSGKAPC
jgi:cysteine desulfurase